MATVMTNRPQRTGRPLAGHIARTLVAVGIVTSSLSLAPTARAGCDTDNDCKGDRICVESACAAPPPASCSKDVDCAGDQVCSDGFCALSTPAPSPEPAPPAPAVAPAPAAPLAPAAPAVAPGADTGETKGILGLIIAGPIVLGATWLTTIGATAGLGGSGKAIGYAATPVIGPWMIIGEDAGDYTAALVASGLAQAGGLTMLIVGLTVQRPVAPRVALGDVEMTIAPSASPETAALMATGSF
jgi:hypothetical protein